MSLLALRVSKIDPSVGHEGHGHAKPKRIKGLWTVRIEQHQEANDDDHYVWLYEGAQIKQKLYAAGALVLVIAIVMFPLWPLVMRQGVWYLSMGMLGLIGLFFVMAIFRLILFVVTLFAAPPGLWLYPNLFEDVGFFDSFRPVWAWHQVSLLFRVSPHYPCSFNTPFPFMSVSTAKPVYRTKKPKRSPRKPNPPPRSPSLKKAIPPRPGNRLLQLLQLLSRPPLHPPPLACLPLRRARPSSANCTHALKKQRRSRVWLYLFLSLKRDSEVYREEQQCSDFPLHELGDGDGISTHPLYINASFSISSSKHS